MSSSILTLIGRILLAAVFIPAGWSKLMAIEGTAGYIASVGLPAATMLAWAAAIFEVVAGLAILVGFQTKWAAIALAAFCAFTAFVFHGGADQMQQIMMFKNLGLAGGFLALAGSGAGPLSVDAKRG
ncbi:MAG: DoxX family protein [Rhizobiaceae bacterium]